MKRNASIELYRILLMYGIVTLHVPYVLGPAFCWENIGLAWCVDGFVFITGWFGIRFSVRKLALLYGTALVSAFMIEGLAIAFGHGLGDNVFDGVVRHIKGMWFLHAYAVMMCLAPLVNAVLQSRDWRALVPFSALVFGWGLAVELPIVLKIIPHPAGIGSFTGLTLLGVYAVARIVRLYDFARLIKTRHILFALPVLFGLCIFGDGWLGYYASPIAVLMAAAVFFLFLRIRVPSAIAPMVQFLGASMFPVYVVHIHPWVLALIKDTGDRASGVNHSVVCFGLGLVVFVATLLFDFPRRLVVAFVRRFWHAN